MSKDKCGCPHCDGYGYDDIQEIIASYGAFIANPYISEEDLHDALTSLMNEGFMIGFKSALIERVESDLKTIQFLGE